jgi:hypothetical protein
MGLVMPKALPKATFNILWSTRLCAGLLVSMLTACTSFDDHDHPDLKSGEDLFNHHCETCHGVDGSGKLVSGTPANILTQRGRDGIVNYITSNVNPQREMPVFNAMPYAEAIAITNHLLVLQRDYDALPFNKKKPLELMIEP